MQQYSSIIVRIIMRMSCKFYALPHEWPVDMYICEDSYSCKGFVRNLCTNLMGTRVVCVNSIESGIVHLRRTLSFSSVLFMYMYIIS